MLDRGENIFLVDVREPNEYEIVSIPGADADPQGRVPVRRRAGAPARRTSGSCCTARAGCGRPKCLAVVKDAGFSDAVHVGGGVLAWISQVDPSLPAY